MHYDYMLYVPIVVAIFFILFTYKRMVNKCCGTDKMQEIALAIRQGAMAFLHREYSILLVFMLVVAILLVIIVSVQTMIAFVFGAVCSVMSGYIGMRVATIANVRSANAARTGLNPALRIAFSSGAILGVTVAALGLLGILVLNYLFEGNTEIIFGFGFGASSVALFARVGGGIYTKAADMAADLVGKVEQNIPEDDPRNPAVIADNVGDCVGDVAGMGADLFESYVGSIIAAMALGYTIYGNNGIYFPLAVVATGLLTSIISTFFVRSKDESKIHTAFRNALIISNVLLLTAVFYLSKTTFGTLGAFWATLSGMIGGILIGILTEYYTSASYSPVKRISKSSESSPATTIIEGLSIGMISTFLPIIVLCLIIFTSYKTEGLFGIALSAVGMLSTIGISLAIDAYGPVVDTAGGIAEMANLDKEVRKRTDALDSVGNTTAAMGKGFAIGSAALTALGLFSSYTQEMHLDAINICNPYVIISIFLGASIPFVFSSLSMTAVGRSAFDIINEVRRQFKENKEILKGTSKPDYSKCVSLATKSALHKMIMPGILAIVSPVIIKLLLGPEALGGFLASSLATGIILAIFMANSGGAWDNAKKYIEAGHFGGKGSDAHKASVIGDTVGDPLKDTTGPSINILLKLMSIVSLVFLSA